MIGARAWRCAHEWERGVFEAALRSLAPGRHTFKFIVHNQWMERGDGVLDVQPDGKVR